MFFIIVIVIGLVAWALHLMQEAIQHKEFSLMLAGFLVSTAAVGMMAVYFLMNHYVGYMSEMEQRAYVMQEWSNPVVWSGYTAPLTGDVIDPSEVSLNRYSAN